jgi:zinc transport system ATP-binding protein
LVEFCAVSKRFLKRVVLDNVSFNINPGTVTTMVGPNGAGKTTVVRVLLGLESPSFGSVRRKPGIVMAYVPQKIGVACSMPMTCNNYANALNLNVEQIRRMMPGLDADKLLSRQMSELSGGELQRFLLATALAKDPDLIILDEPTSHLDIDSSEVFFSIIKQMRSERKVAIFMVSHDLHAVSDASDQVLCLNRHICCSGVPDRANDQVSPLSNLIHYTHNHDHYHFVDSNK